MQSSLVVLLTESYMCISVCVYSYNCHHYIIADGPLSSVIASTTQGNHSLYFPQTLLDEVIKPVVFVSTLIKVSISWVLMKQTEDRK